MAAGQIDGERATEDAVATMTAANPNFVAEHRAIYEAICAHAAAREEVAAAEEQL